MIILQHHNGRVKRITNQGLHLYISEPNHITRQLLKLGNLCPEALIVWCEEPLFDDLNIDVIQKLCHHRRMLHSFGHGHFLNPAIGFVEDTPFVNVSRRVSYPTWQMHSAVGVVHGEVLNLAGKHIKADNNFDYFLTSMAKCLMPLGLFCYSSPQLLKSGILTEQNQISTTHILFRFVKQHYKTRWTLFLLACFIIYNKQWPLWSFIKSLFYNYRRVPADIIKTIPLESSPSLQQDFTIDVVIPTIGRKAYLYDVLKDLAAQTVIPKKVIIIEQNPDEGTESELSYLSKEFWPFKIEHVFTHKTGACNARNLGLTLVDSNFVFLADDDNRFDKTLIENIKTCFNKTGNKCITTSYIQKNELIHHTIEKQWSTFGAGNSFLNMNLLKNIRFNLAFEHGYGEDTDFGMQLRNAGIDVIYVPSPAILHLKAPMGGFRTRFKQPWEEEHIKPKPSPTVMLFRLLHQTTHQLDGYQLRLFFNLFKHHKPFKLFTFVKHFRKSWANSLKWAAYLKSLQ